VHVIQVMFVMGSSQKFLFSSDPAAKNAYAALKTAMENYRAFKNDRTETVTVTDESGEATFRVDQIASLGIQDCQKSESVQTEYAEWCGRLEGAASKSAGRDLRAAA